MSPEEETEMVGQTQRQVTKGNGFRQSVILCL